MLEHPGVQGGCVERGCIPLPKQHGGSGHPPPTDHALILGHNTHLPGALSPTISPCTPVTPQHRSHLQRMLPLGGYQTKPLPHGCPHPGLTLSARCRWAGPRGGRRRQRP